VNCPECGSLCDRDEGDVGVGIIAGPWGCIECGWTEDDAFPMTDDNWEDWLINGPSPDAYV